MKVYLYSRVSTSAQTLEQQERTVYEWLNAHHMKVDEIVSDEGISGGITYAERNLGKKLLPKTKEGDMIIVSEISRLGRSMFDLSKLIHTELKPRKLRLVVVSMGIDLRCDKLTAIDELILNNFSFAAQLEKQLISERTLSALAVKKAQGVKLGAASEKYQESVRRRTERQIELIAAKKRKTHQGRYMGQKETKAFVTVLKRVFPAACQSSRPNEWSWGKINTRGEKKKEMLRIMSDFHTLDDTIFKGWDFSEDINSLQRKLSTKIYSLKRSALRAN